MFRVIFLTAPPPFQHKNEEKANQKLSQFLVMKIK